jgi:peptidyl-prolyl cis-trans isomerase D
MLKTMRQNTKVILWIIIVAFVGTIIFAWGMNITGRNRAGTAVVGVINGQKISLQQFRHAFQNIYTQAQERMDQELDVETFRQLRDETWNQIVSQILLSDEIKKRDILVTDEELLAYIRSNPPPYIRNNENLQTDGQFDPQKYAAVLADPRYDWRPLENQYRAMIPMLKLQDMILATVRVTDAEVLEDYKAKNEKVQVRYVSFLPSDFQTDSEAITDEEIGQYYEQHSDDFYQPRTVNLQYVFVEKTPSQADEDSSRADLVAIRERILADENFAELAEAFSQGPSAKDGGDLGFFGRGVMDSAFEASAFALEEGEISDPVRTSFGWHIIKLEERRGTGSGEEIRARHILLQVRPSQETLQALADRCSALAERAQEVGLMEAAGEMGFVAAETGFFKEGNSFLPGLGRASDAAAYAFSEKPERIGGPFENETGFYVVSILEKIAAGVPDLERIREHVKMALVRDRQKELALQKALDLQQQLAEGMSLDAAAAAASLTVDQTNFFARRDYVPQIGRSNEFLGTAFGLQEGGRSDVVETDRGFYILQVVARQQADLEQFQTQEQALKLDLLRRKQNRAYNDWFEGVMRGAEIEDYRDRFFRG